MYMPKIHVNVNHRHKHIKPGYNTYRDKQISLDLLTALLLISIQLGETHSSLLTPPEPTLA